MMELWGNKDCESCEIIKQLLSSTPLRWKYVDVSTINFEGMIPRLKLDDGTEIVGPQQIKDFVKKKLVEKGLFGMV